MRFSIRSLAFLVGGLMVGTALAPVGAQQIAPADGQLAVRSDGAVYVIINAKRHWVPTVQITDAELNAYPEGEPIYGGLAPIGSQTGTTTTRVLTPPTASTTTTTTATGTTSTTGLVSQVDPNLPIEVDIDGEEKLEPGERIIVDIRSNAGATCELIVKWADGKEENKGAMPIDSDGRCHYSIEIADNATVGIGVLQGTVREGGRMSRQDAEFEIIPKS